MYIWNMNTPILLSLLATLTLAAPDGGDKLIRDFQDPPKAARPYVWWHWMDGEVSLDGIRKDLEWMDAAGIAGFHQFDAGGVNMPKAAPFKRPYLSDSWKEAFRYAVRLADSLGMEMTVASAPGWSCTGGPWVSPEDAMKKLEWQTVEVPGGTVEVRLPELKHVTGPYQDIPLRNERLTAPSYGYDIAVIAVKLPSAEKGMEELGGTVVKAADTCITVSFPRKTLIRACTIQSLPTGIRPRLGNADGPNEIQYSLNGKDWKTLVRIPKSPQDFTTMNIPPTKARHFRAVGPHIQDLRLHTVRKVEHVEEKAGFANCYDFYRYPTEAQPGEACALDAGWLAERRPGRGRSAPLHPPCRTLAHLPLRRLADGQDEPSRLPQCDGSGGGQTRQGGLGEVLPQIPRHVQGSRRRHAGFQGDHAPAGGQL